MKSLITITLLILFVSASSTFYPGQQEKFRNLKILPSHLTKGEMNKIMEGYAAALGVDCNYCHVKNKTGGEYDHASDEKGEKDIARKMITMTSEINKKYFNFNGSSIVVQSVMCITCHRAEPLPVMDTIPPLKKKN